MSEHKANVPLPEVPFHTDDLLGIASVITGYVKYLESLPPTPQRKKRINILSPVAEKLHTQLAVKGDIALPLTPEEVEEVIGAFVNFLQRLPGVVPPSAERDAAINLVNIWRLRLISIISEFTTE